jgi:hypothetical protein
MKTTDSDPVQDYILEGENNLHIAAAVFDAWSKVRRKLVLGFLGRLEHALSRKTELEGWTFGRLWGEPFEDAEAGFDFWRPTWREEYYVGLHFWNYGQEMSFGLGRDADKEHIRKSPHCDELLAAVKEHYVHASHRTWWEANVRMQPEDDWQKPEVLWRMRDENDEFLNEVAAQLLDVANISAPFVDELIGKK